MERNGWINDVTDRKIIELRNRFNNVMIKKRKEKGKWNVETF